jgi:hypothetical protein
MTVSAKEIHSRARFAKSYGRRDSQNVTEGEIRKTGRNESWQNVAMVDSEKSVECSSKKAMRGGIGKTGPKEIQKKVRRDIQKKAWRGIRKKRRREEFGERSGWGFGKRRETWDSRRRRLTQPFGHAQLF